MYSQFELPVSISIRPCIWLKIWIYLIHLVSIPTVIFSGIPLVMRMAIFPAIFVNLYLVRKKFILLKSRSSVVSVYLNDLEEWWLTTADGRTFMATLMPAAVVNPLLTVLCFKSGDQRYPVILTPQKGNQNELRRLRVRLRFKRKGRGEVNGE